MPDVSTSLQSSATRRSLIGAGVGALAALVAGALGRPQAVLAEGEPMVVGGAYTDAHTETRLKNTVNDNTVFHARSTNGGYGVLGETAFGSAAVHGRQTGPGRLIVGSLGAPGIGVVGQSNGQRGMFAVGQDTADGIWAATEHGTAVYAQGPAADAFALKVEGRAAFTRSGVASVGSGKSQVIVNLDPVTADTFALATLQQYRSGVHVAATEISVANKTLTIRLNTTVGSATKVAWIALED